jgi:hypothetical protein
VGPLEKELQQRLRSIGAQWNPAAKVWLASGDGVKRIGLQARIVRGRY